MKKTALLILVLCVVTVFAWDFKRALWEYEWNGSQWVTTNKAQLWIDEAQQITRSCDSVNWGPYNWTDHLSLAQWINIYVQGTYTYWRVAKPGIYCGCGPEFYIKSNGDFTMDWDSLGDLTGGGGTIPKWYWWGPNDDPPPVGASDWDDYWTRSYDFNNYPFNDTTEWHAWLWERVDVDTLKKACEYEDTGIFTITLLDQKPWIINGVIRGTPPSEVPEEE
uniref:Uncharacterized protein n=1 Tax=candidate division WOR-3 bacterium TaxID=2052148 RepID=A0A7C6A927_UNCW3